MIFSIQKVSEDKLTCQVWEFEFLAGHICGEQIVLVRYLCEHRQTTRHSWERVGPETCYDRWNNCPTKLGYGLPATEVPRLPDAEVREALYIALSNIRIQWEKQND